MSVVLIVSASVFGCGGGQLKLTKPIDVKNLVVIPSVHTVESEVDLEESCLDRAGKVNDALAKWFADKVADDLQSRGTGTWTVASEDLPGGEAPGVFRSTLLWGGPPMLASRTVTFFVLDGDPGEPCSGMLVENRKQETDPSYSGTAFPEDWHPDADAVLLIHVNFSSNLVTLIENNWTVGPDLLVNAKMMTHLQYAILDRKDGALLAYRNVGISENADPSGSLEKQFSKHVPRITDIVAETFLGEEK